MASKSKALHDYHYMDVFEEQGKMGKKQSSSR